MFSHCVLLPNMIDKKGVQFEVLPKIGNLNNARERNNEHNADNLMMMVMMMMNTNYNYA